MSAYTLREFIGVVLDLLDAWLTWFATRNVKVVDL